MTKAGSATHDAATGTVSLTTIFEEGEQGATPRRWVRSDRLRLVSADELVAFAEDAGLVVEVLAGGYGLEPLGPAASVPSSWPSSPRSGVADTGTSGGVNRTNGPRGIVGPMAPNEGTRLLVVEDVPQVAQYIRGLLNSQAHVKLARRHHGRQQGRSARSPNCARTWSSWTRCCRAGSRAPSSPR